MTDTSGFDFSNSDDPRSAYGNILTDGEIYSSKSGPFRILKGSYFGRIVAVKCLKPQYAESLAHINLLRREGSLQSSLNHPGIARVFSVEDIPGIGVAIIMEYIDSPTLASYLSSSQLSFRDARQIFNRLCGVLEYLHSNGIVHRDLKPENILIHPKSKEIKIIDFGLSHGSSFADVPLPGGTNGFSAPEQFEKGNLPSPTADIWSVGKLMNAIFYNWANADSAKNKTSLTSRFSAIFHPAETAWMQTASCCVASDPSDRPKAASEVKRLFDLRISKTRNLRNSLVIGLGCALLATLLIFPGILHNKQPITAEDEQIADSRNVNTVSNSQSTDLHTEVASLPPADEEKDSKENNSSADQDLPPLADKEVPHKNKENKESTSLAGEPLETSEITEEKPVGKPMTDMEDKFWHFYQQTFKKHYNSHINLLRTLTTQEQLNVALSDKWLADIKREVGQYRKQNIEGKCSNNEYIRLCVLYDHDLNNFIKKHQNELNLEQSKMLIRTGLSAENP